MATTETAFRAAIDAAITALQGGDYATARSKLLEADMINAALPLSASYERGAIQRRESLERLQLRLDQVQAIAESKADKKRLHRTHVRYRAGGFY